MTPLIRRLRTAVHRFRSGREGSATLEFALLFPPVILMMMSGAEAGLLNMRNAMLERGVEIAVRAVRLGPATPPTHEELKQMICDQAVIIPDCMKSLSIELTRVTRPDWTVMSDTATCRDRMEDIKPAVGFTPGAPNDLMLVRACMKAAPLFPTTGLGLMMQKDANGDYAAVATSAFVNEP